MKQNISKADTPTRLAIGGLFIMAGVGKLIDTREFVTNIAAYDLELSGVAIKAVAVVLPPLEVICGFALCINWWRETVRPIVGVLACIFVFALGQAQLRGLHLDCGCLGAGTPGWLKRLDVALIRSILLLSGSLFLMINSVDRMSPPVRGAKAGTFD